MHVLEIGCILSMELKQQRSWFERKPVCKLRIFNFEKKNLSWLQLNHFVPFSTLDKSSSSRCSNLCQLPNGYNSRCEQKYVQKRLVTLGEYINNFDISNLLTTLLHLCRSARWEASYGTLLVSQLLRLYALKYRRIMFILIPHEFNFKHLIFLNLIILLYNNFNYIFFISLNLI